MSSRNERENFISSAESERGAPRVRKSSLEGRSFELLTNFRISTEPHPKIMTTSNTNPAAPSQEFIEFAQEVFQLARTGDAPSLVRLLQRGLPPNMSNHKGDTLLMLAAYHGHIDATRALLEAGAEPDRYNDMAQTPLGASAFKGYLPIVELLLAHDAQPDFAPPGGKSPLMFAAMFNRLEIVKVLLAQGVNIDAKSSEGLSALELARSMGAADTAAFLESGGH